MQINKPIHSEVINRSLNIGASIGIAMYPKDDMNIENLIRKADAAMYHAKEAGRNQICFASTKIEKQNQAYLELEAAYMMPLQKKNSNYTYNQK